MINSAVTGIFLDSSGSAWSSVADDRWCLHYVGDQHTARRIFEWLQLHAVGQLSILQFGSLLASLPNEWAFVAWSGERRLAATDRIRSYPLFFSMAKGNVSISNSARLLRGRMESDALNRDALLEFAMAGYVTGSDTLYTGVKQLQAGELIAMSANEAVPHRHRYYRYIPQPVAGGIGQWREALAVTTEQIFKRTIEKAQGRPLLIPLSGGLDSRLIVCMLRHLKYDNVRTFSYGLPGNYEAKIAREVAGKLGLPWEFVPTTHSGFRNFFWSKQRKAFSDFADGLCAVPTMQDIHPLWILRERGLPNDTIVINGQSGDFISGGHIPAQLLNIEGRQTVVESIYGRHFGLSKRLMTPANIATVSERIRNDIGEMDVVSKSRVEPAGLYESWEWQERQCKYVISWQRGYDWLRLGWHLPLWDADYMDLWSRVPYELKLNQKLYKEYLQTYDYFGLFKKFAPPVWRWPGATIAIVPFARVVGLISGTRNKERIYSYARYMGHYGPYYAPWGLRNFLRYSSDARNPVTFFVNQWFRENGIQVGNI